MKQSINWLMLSVLIFIFPIVTTAQSVPLGTAGNFVFFTTNGALGIAENSIVTGNVGTNVGAITIYDNINGVIHPPSAVTIAAGNDLLLAYNMLNAMAPTKPATSELLGNGGVLTKGVYPIGMAASLNGNLFLDAEGDSSAVFVFKIAGTLSSGVSSQVVLTNGAQACNVFWKVEGLVSLATNTQMKGNVIANNAAITLGTGVQLEGRALSTTGAVNTGAGKAALPLGCGMARLTGPAEPNLASANCFALFTGNGTVTGNPAAIVKGDIGTNVGTVSGFDPLLVTGKIHLAPDAATSNANTDLMVANTFLANTPFDIQLMFPAMFGDGLELTPHTYLLSGETSLAGTLVLNAQGNPDAVFIIKINGAFSSAVNSTVELINGAQASNVYWHVVGAVDLGSNTAFKGSLVCNGGALSLQSGVVAEGRVLTVTGALAAAAMNAQIPDAVCAILPVTWTHFSARTALKKVVLEWATSSEINNNFFTVEKSADKVLFTQLARVDAAQAGGKLNNYSLTDVNPLPVAYYRLSQTDRDGHKSYYKTIQVTTGENAGLKVVTYLTPSAIIVQAAGVSAGTGSIVLLNSNGTQVSSQKIVMTGETNNFRLPKPQQPGLYVISIQLAGKNLYRSKLIVQ